ncbi:MAG: outer membrane protein assembly factor BamA, partial [Bacteroidota bacterium]|nr:outer membrane protein assembly factor BamA [Bacteroidota bacterium]
MLKKLIFTIAFIAGCAIVNAQQTATQDTIVNPVIQYNNSPQKYEIAGITVSGVKNYEDYVIIGFSGLTVGQQITVPGDDITNAVKRFWKHGL